MSLGKKECPGEAELKKDKACERVEGQVGWKETRMVRDMRRPCWGRKSTWERSLLDQQSTKARELQGWGCRGNETEGVRKEKGPVYIVRRRSQ